MKKQDYSNHVRYYTPHHFVLYPILLVLITLSATYIFKYPEKSLEWKFITALFILLAWFSFMVRQHYALTLQNRVVRLELRVRYFQLTSKRLETIEPQLTFGQIAALRFASDEELPELLQATIQNKLSPGQIKRSIKNWLPDNMRV
jgi:hypothetical protein